MLRPIIVLAFLALIPTTALGTTYLIQPDGTGDFPTIQAAIDEADPGDIIELAGGTFTGDGNRDIDYLGKAITVRSQSDIATMCVIDCQGSEIEPHRGFIFHSGEDENSVVQGVTITNGYAADWGGGILLETNAINIDAVATIHNCHLIGNEAPEGAGLAFIAGWENPGFRILQMTNCEVYDNQGDGLFMSGQLDPCVIIRGCNISNNHGAGLSAFGWTPENGMIIEQCNISNNDSHGINAGIELIAMNISDCHISGNGGSGLYGFGEAFYCNISDCTMTKNVANGIFIQYPVGTIQGCLVTENGGAGIKFYTSNVTVLNCEIRSNSGVGLLIGHGSNNHLIPRSRSTSSVVGCKIWQNGEEGIRIDDEVYDIDISFSTIIGNMADGIRNSGEEIMGGLEFTLSNSTVAYNAGNALIYDSEIPGTLMHNILAFNAFSAVQCLSGAIPEIICSDLFGNIDGDWVDCVADQYAVSGNISEDPLFCDPAADEFYLQGESPCSPGNNPDCGLIGALEVGCNPTGPAITVVDVPNDQGGWVIVSWPAFEQEPGIYGYEVQRLEENIWATLAEIPAEQLPSYSVEVETDDIYVVGDPEPISDYRVVGYTPIPEETYYSLEAGGYSIDNIAPPVPELTLWDGIDFRVLLWENPAIEDFSEVCVFRGTEPGFEPDTPVNCTSEEIYNEGHLNYYCYVVAAFDIHGNTSDYSNEVCGTYPTNVDNVPRQLTLEQNRPNPFNPTTSISFGLPNADHVRLSVYSASGKLIKTLIDMYQSAGTHEAQWNGRNMLGAEMPSGVYYTRLEVGESTSTGKMTLVR